MPFIRKYFAIFFSLIIIFSVAHYSEQILTFLITPLPKDLRGCLSDKFSNSVSAQLACTSITSTQNNSIAAWQVSGGNVQLRESNLYEQWSTGKVGIGTTSPGFGLHVNRTTNTGNTISVANRLFMTGKSMSGTTVSLSSNAYINDAGTWTVPTAADRSTTIEMRSTGIIDMYGTVTAGATNWRHMFGFNAPSNVAYFPSGNVGVGTSNPGWQLTVTEDLGVASNVNSGAPLDVGSSAVDYPANSGWASTWNTNILLNGLDSTSISFHDASDSVGVLRYRDNRFYMGESGGWGTSGLTVGGNITAPSVSVSGAGTFGPTTSSWTPYDVSGTYGGYAGFNFTSEGIRLMMDSVNQGVHSDSGWLWYFSNGVLTHGAIPWARLTGVPTFSVNATNGRVRTVETGCGSSWASSCDDNTNGYTDYADKLWATSHVGTYYLYASWDNTYWWLRSNHGSAVRVGQADRAQSVVTADGGFGYLTMSANGIHRVGGSVFELQYTGGGAVRVGGGATANLIVNGTVNGTTISDQNLKKNISTIQSPLSTLSELRGVTYEWENPSLISEKYMIEAEGIHHGFVAQEIEKKFPSWVTTNADGYKVIKDNQDTVNGLFALIIEAFKEFVSETRESLAELTKRLSTTEARVEALEAKIQERDKKISDLEERLQKLENATNEK